MPPEATQAGLAATLGLDWKLFLAQLVNFAIVLIVLHRLAWKPLLSAMERRRSEIQEGLTNAEKAKEDLVQAESARTETLNEARREAKALLETAQSDAEKKRAETLAMTKIEVERELSEARTRLHGEKEAAVKALKGELAALIALATEKVSQQAMDGDVQRALIQDAIKEMER